MAVRLSLRPSVAFAGAVVTAAVQASVGCAPDQGLLRLPDTGFRTDAANLDSGVSDDTGVDQGCSLLDSERVCASDERCVPTITGENQCVATGLLEPGVPCGEDGQDRCQRGSLCVASAVGGSVCRVLCDPAAAAGCGEGQTCDGPPWLLAAGAGICVSADD